MEIRKALFSIARFMVLLDDNGIEPVMVSEDWNSEHKEVVKRLFKELQELREQQKKNGVNNHTVFKL